MPLVGCSFFAPSCDSLLCSSAALARFSQLQAFASLGRRLFSSPLAPPRTSHPAHAYTLPLLLCLASGAHTPCMPKAIHSATRRPPPIGLWRSRGRHACALPLGPQPQSTVRSHRVARILQAPLLLRLVRLWPPRPPLACLVTGRSGIHHPTTHPRREPQPLNFGRNALRDILSPPPPSSSTTSTSPFSSNDFSRLSTPPPPSHTSDSELAPPREQTKAAEAKFDPPATTESQIFSSPPRPQVATAASTGTSLAIRECMLAARRRHGGR
jgi:hypothetical protein